MGNKKIECKECNVSFATTSSLRRHVKRVHGNGKINELAPMSYKSSTLYKYSCGSCGKNFNKQKHLAYHVKKYHTALPTTSTCSAVVKNCPMCHFQNSQKSILIQHFQQVHQIDIKQNIFEIPWESFEKWKQDVESKTSTKFVIEYSNITDKKVIKNFICHRSGKYMPEGMGKRHLKTQGSCKIDGFCPSSIKVFL